MKVYLGWAVVLFCLAGSVQADQLKLRFMIMGGDGPAADVTVVENQFGQYDTADEQGRVTFDDITLPVEIKALGLGFETLVQQIVKPEETLYLTPIHVDMAGVDVVADRVPQKISKITLSKQELRYTPGSQGDPIKVIQTLPGVVAANDGTGQVYIRGSDIQETGVWINRLPAAYLFHWGGTQSVINPTLVQDFNLFLGGFPAEYDNRLGGFIDVRLREPKRDRLHQHYSIGTYESSFLLEGPIGDTGRDSIFIAARRSYVDLLMSAEEFTDAFSNNDAPEDERNEVVSVPEFFDAQLLWHRELQEGSLETQFYAATDRMAVINNADAKSDPELAGRLNLEVGFWVAGSVWRQQWSEAWDHVIALSYHAYSEDISFGNNPDTGRPYYVQGTYPELSLQPEFRFRQNAHTTWSFGAELSWARFPIDMNMGIPTGADDPDSNFTSANKLTIKKTIKARTTEPYIKLRQAWNEQFSSELGLRYADISATGGVALQGFSPRISLEYQATPELLLYGRWGKYLQMPQGYQLLEGFGNPSLGFTKAEHRILGSQYQVLPKWMLQTELYHKPMSDLVVVDNDAVPPDTFSNNGGGVAYGIDIMLKRQANDQKMGWISYSYGRSRRSNEITGQEYDFVGEQPHTLTLVWGQPMTGNWSKWRWGIKLQAHTGRPHTPVIGRTGTCYDGSNYYSCVNQPSPESDPEFSHWRAVHGDVNSERLPVYYKLDLRLDRTWLLPNRKVNFYIDLQNISFRENVEDYDYGNSYQHINNPEPVTGMPFFPFFGLELEF